MTSRLAIRQLGALRPDVLVLELRLPDGTSAERIERLQERSPRTRIVVIAMEANRMFAVEALKAGALGFVLSDRADRELSDAVRCAARGLTYMSPRSTAS